WASKRSRKQNLEYYPFPFYMAYAASLLKKNGVDAKLRDAIADKKTKPEVLKFLKKENPDAVLISTSTPSIYSDLDFAEKIKKEIDTKIIFSGPHSTALPEEILSNDSVDFIVFGEYEFTLLELVKEFSKKTKDYEKIKGIGFKKKGRIIINERRQLLKDLDSLPYPEREELPIYSYNDPFCKKHPSIPLIATRGCPYQCIFCLEPHVFYGKPNYRKRDPKNVVDEMMFLIKKYKAKELYFDDTSLTVDKEFIKKLCIQIIDKEIKISWSCMGDAKTDYETLKLMKKSGCTGIKFGVESADPKILKNINKPLDLETVKRFVKNCNKLGIFSHGTYMFGLPGETKKTIKKTIDFAFSLGSTSAQFSVATPFPGTPFYKMAKENGWLITEDWTKFEGAQTPVISYENVTEKDLQDAIEYAKKKRIIQILKRPEVAFQYLTKIYNMKGFSGLIKEAYQKTHFLLN
ncbi:radical SAM protein, partial [Candidatus Woesearchaeota archaeon]|nr:radical SAM protein [Candidatus Woesearchaeota archaeon]